MFQLGPYKFLIAESVADLEQIHALNHATFVREIPQHKDPGSGRLIDKFHHKNKYFICRHGAEVVGMLSVHDKPPFSVADRLPNPELLDAPGSRPLEVRLLAVRPDVRSRTVFTGLVWALLKYVTTSGHTHLWISGFEGQIQLYDSLGFEPLGPPVGPAGSRFIPMRVSVAELRRRHARTSQRLLLKTDDSHRDSTSPASENGSMKESSQHSSTRNGTTVKPAMSPLSLLPGPVALASAVRQAADSPPLYHRSQQFVSQFRRVRDHLRRLVGNVDVAIFPGGGTLANDVIAATLAGTLPQQQGLILSNGEFGDRLVRHARGAGLDPAVLSFQWGKPWDLDAVSESLHQLQPGDWIWAVHQETSTGVLNDLPALAKLAAQQSLRLCIDAVSSLGAVPLDLRQIFLASGTSGKALAATAGIAIVFAHQDQLQQLPSHSIPPTLDLLSALQTDVPRFTFPSAPLHALNAALMEYATPARAALRFEAQAQLGQLVRAGLRAMAVQPLADDSVASPVVTTFSPPGPISAPRFLQHCLQHGFQIAGHSHYLQERGLVQIANMGSITAADIKRLIAVMQAADVPAKTVDLRH